VLLKAVMLVETEASQPGRAYTGSRLTALEHVANRPIAHHVLDGLREACLGGIIVAGEADALIDMRACLREYEPALEHVEYVVCRAGLDIASVLRAVASVVGEAPCLIQPADGVLDQPMTTLIDLLAEGSPDLVLCVTREGDNPPDRGEASFREVTDSRHSHTIADIGLFGPGALSRATERLESVENADLATVAQQLAAAGVQVMLHPVDGWHRYRGHGWDLLSLNRVALDRLTGSIPSSARAGNRFEGRVLIDPTATVRSSVITGPAVIGPGATVIDAYLGPYTTIGAGARIEGVEIERSIVSPGANVTHVGGRLVSSIVGRDARVYRDFSLPRAVRLWVGDGDEVALC
jgi:glucose-1-phosphate thymidylyltransferase